MSRKWFEECLVLALIAVPLLCEGCVTVICRSLTNNFRTQIRQFMVSCGAFMQG